MSVYSSFCDQCDLDMFCDFMDYVNNTNMSSPYDWENENLEEYVTKYKHKRNPSYKQYMSHNLLELIELYQYLIRNFKLSFGPFEIFCELVYITSSNNILLNE